MKVSVKDLQIAQDLIREHQDSEVPEIANAAEKVEIWLGECIVRMKNHD